MCHLDRISQTTLRARKSAQKAPMWYDWYFRCGGRIQVERVIVILAALICHGMFFDK